MARKQVTATLIPERCGVSGFDVVLEVSMLHQWFTCVRLSNPHMLKSCLSFSVTFTTTGFRTAAAYGRLESVPANRLRRALLHLGYSIELTP